MTTMLYVGVILFGLLSYFKLSQELFPNISVPKLVVITKYANAAPEEIENLITKPIEEAVSTVSHLKRLTSISKEGISAVTLDFSWGTDIGFAHLAVREKIDRMKDRLPIEAEEAIIKRMNPFSRSIVVVSVTGELDLADMTDLATDVIKKKLEKTDGVGSVMISGGQKREILVEVDRGRLDASRVSLPMVVDSLKNSNYSYPAGTTQGKTVEYLIRTNGEFKRIEEISKTIVHVENPEFDPVFKWKKREEKDHSSAPREQRLIPLSSLAEVKMSLQEKSSYSRYNGRENISISIQKHADANTVKVAKNVREALKELEVSLPSKMKLDVVYDESEYILASLGNMRDNVLIGAFLAFFVLLYFLGNVRDAFNVGVAIPCSLLLVFIAMYLGGLSVNMLTLAGLALGVGSLTDCAICISENIVRHQEHYKKPALEAAMDGANEMVASMVSSSLTNIAVFLPLLFVTGIAQQLFRDLFYVSVMTNIAALVVSLTLIPRLLAYVFHLAPAFLTPRFLRLEKATKIISSMNAKFERSLDRMLDRPKLVAKMIGVLAAGAFVAVLLTPKVFMPKMDQRQFQVNLDMPIGTKLEVTNAVASKVENILLSIDDVDAMVSVGSAQEEEEIDALGSHQARVAVKLKDSCRYSTDQILQKLISTTRKENLEGGHLTFELQDSPLRTALAGGAPIEVEVKGPDLKKLEYISNELVKKFESDPDLYGVKTTFALPSKETQVIVDKDRAASFEMSVADIARSALIAIKGFVATKFKEGGKETDIRVRLRKQDREDNSSIRSLALRSPRGHMIPLDSVAQVKPGHGSSEIRHIDQQRALIVSAEVDGSVGSAVKKVKKMIVEYRAFKDHTVELGGESKRLSESFSSLQFTFILAIFLVFMVMAAEFESLTQPLVIMLTVPFSFVGVAYMLLLTGTPLSSVAVLGVLILAGLVVNNGIVLIDHINGLRENGMALREAVVQGSTNRLRPILITSLSSVLAVVPLALGFGKGDELAQPLGIVTFGGLFVSTALTLYVIPMLYYYLAIWQEKKKSEAGVVS